MAIAKKRDSKRKKAYITQCQDSKRKSCRESLNCTCVYNRVIVYNHTISQLYTVMHCIQVCQYPRISVSLHHGIRASMPRLGLGSVRPGGSCFLRLSAIPFCVFCPFCPFCVSIPLSASFCKIFFKNLLTELTQLW